MTDLVYGATAAGSLAIGLFFLRYWRDSGDRLFLGLAGAFALFAVNRVILGALERDSEARALVYSVRLAAFLLIIAAVIDRNRR